MAIRNIRRQASNPGAYPGTPTSAPIYVDSDDNKLKFIPAGSGTTEVEVIDASSTQTLSNKKFGVTEAAADGAITIASGIVKITKAGVCALTLAAPTAADEGTRITIISMTDNAHTVTFPTDKLNDGTTGVNELATFAAFAGASMTVVALGTAWYTESLVAVTPSSTV